MRTGLPAGCCPVGASGRTGPLLVTVSQQRDRDGAAGAFLRSRNPVDIELEELMQAISLGPVRAEVLYHAAEVLLPRGQGRARPGASGSQPSAIISAKFPA